ncbi:MAG TPA: YkgJ family cysteine cluster protein [Polyangiaceae bacterium]|nr:YkgJ family cysteine cluster protein [Polyangiaceae bacterium]
MSETPPSCLGCGACCFSNLETSVRVTGDDYERLGEAAERLVRFVGHRAYMHFEEGRCAALRIDAVEGVEGIEEMASAGRFACTVYEARPETCRSFERGSPQCAGELATKGGRPEAKLIELRARRP